MSRQPDLGKLRRWLRHVQGWQRSRLSVRDYCARHRLSEASFYAWRRVLDERGLLTPGTATEDGLGVRVCRALRCGDVAATAGGAAGASMVTLALPGRR